ncbi:MAG TPA: cobalamin-dependent protein [Baekduia sp.]|jgi:methanogenic corrinoid protein MtbC1|nr:cobalamin-dependent protein [Baekduia sp.]
MPPLDETGRCERRRAAEFERAYADALVEGESAAAEAVIREAIEAGLEEALIDDHVIRPALQLVGDLWAEGDLTIAEEHLATAISLRVLMLQREAFRVARRRASHRILLAGAQGELHVVGLHMAGSLILHAGYDVRLFGADLPIDEISSAVEIHRPAVVGFTTASAQTAANLPAAIDAVRRLAPEAGVMVGGLGVDDAWSAVLDVVVCHHVGDAVQHVDALVQRAAHN